jgi:hypothetical protein
MNWTEILDYNPIDGSLKWKMRSPSYYPDPATAKTFNSRWGGKRTGAKSKQGYLEIGVHGEVWLGHRIVWEMFNGPINAGMHIDHLNGIRHDNRIENLRLASPIQNAINRKIQRNNRSGFKGISPNKKKWAAQIGVNGSTVHIGTFDTKELAHEAYCKAAHLYYGEFASSGGTR